MKVSFRVWKDLEPVLTKRLAQYPSNLDQTAKMNMLLREYLAPIAVASIKAESEHAAKSTERKRAALSGFICVRELKQHPNAQQQTMRCGVCRSAHWKEWQACQELRVEARGT